jgi:hypothetical protein
VRQWELKQSIPIEFEIDIELTERPNGMKALNRGPLLFSLPIKEEWVRKEYTKDDVKREYPYCDYDVRPLSDWNYAFHNRQFELCYETVSDLPFSTEHPPVTIKANMVHIPWSEANGFCKESPDSLTPLGEAQSVMLQPYGSTCLRMTELPCLQ